jgi:hypothetical protein
MPPARAKAPRGRDNTWRHSPPPPSQTYSLSTFTPCFRQSARSSYWNQSSSGALLRRRSKRQTKIAGPRTRLLQHRLAPEMPGEVPRHIRQFSGKPVAHGASLLSRIGRQSAQRPYEFARFLYENPCSVNKCTCCGHNGGRKRQRRTRLWTQRAPRGHNRRLGANDSAFRAEESTRISYVFSRHSYKDACIC